MEAIEYNDSANPEAAARPRRGIRGLLAALLLAGMLGVVGVGTAVATDASADPSASPATTESGTTTDEGTTGSESDGQDCPNRTDEEAETETDASSS